MSDPTTNNKANAQLRAAKRLPAPTPGVVITVPLALWPVYMQLHNIEPKEYQRPVLLIQKVKPS